MKIPFVPAHIFTTDGLAAKIESAREQVQASHKEARQKDNKALSRLLRRNHQLGLKVSALPQPTYKPILIKKQKGKAG